VSAISPEQRQAGEWALADIEKLRTGAWAQVIGTWDASGGQAKDAARYFLEVTVPQGIASLRKRLDSLAAEAWGAWIASANELAQSIQAVVGYKREWGMLGVLYDSAKATGQQLGTAGQKAIEGAGVGAGAFVFLALAFVAWKVLR
jgi:hypothetical protein